MTVSPGHIKRALDWWSCSERFRQLVRTDAERAAHEYDLGFNPDLIRPLWDQCSELGVLRGQPATHPALQAYQEFCDRTAAWRAKSKDECVPDDPRFRTWRARQVARHALESCGSDDGSMHRPLAIELSNGCSVGCWFCGVGATRLVEAWRYTEEHAELWRDVVSVLRARIGAAAKWGLCYWATDPLDTPDYERFALDFSEITGMFPQTTTAQGHKDPARVRRLLRVSNGRGCRVNRFSILTEPQLRRIHDEFGPDELLDVEIVPVTPGAVIPKANAGAFRLLAERSKKVRAREHRKLDVRDETSRHVAPAAGREAGATTAGLPGTIACVSGFLLNMVARSVKLISPCPATDQWPLGYIVFDERTFSSAEQLGRHLEEMMERHMPLAIGPEDRMRLNPAFKYDAVADGFAVATARHTLSVRRPEMADYLRSIGDRLNAGEKTASQIAFAASVEHGVPEAATMGTLGLLFERGVLVEAHASPTAIAPRRSVNTQDR